MLNVKQRLSPKCKWVTETRAGYCNDRDPSQRVVHRRPNSLDSSLGTTEILGSNKSGAVNHVPGLNRLPRVQETNTPPQIARTIERYLDSSLFHVRNRNLIPVWHLVSFLRTKLSWIEKLPHLHFKPPTKLKSRRLHRKR